MYSKMPTEFFFGSSDCLLFLKTSAFSDKINAGGLKTHFGLHNPLMTMRRLEIRNPK